MNAPREATPIQQALEHWTGDRPDLALAWSAPSTRTRRYRPFALVLSGWLLRRAGRKETGLRAIHAGFGAAVADGDALVALTAATLLREAEATETAERDALATLGTRGPGPPSMASAPRVERLRSEGAKLLDDAEACVEQAIAESGAGASETAGGGFLAKLDGPSLQALAEVGSLRLVAPGDLLLRCGDPGDDAFVVVRGQLEVRRPDSPPVQIGTGALVGEIALLTEAPRSADVVATEPCLLLVIGRTALAGLMERHRKLADALARSLRDRVLENLFTANPILRRASAHDRTTLLSQLELQSFSAGTELIEQGSKERGLFFIAAGRVRIVHDDGEPVEIARISAGGTVGEVSLFLRRAATAAAITETTVVALHLAPDRLLAALRPLPELFVDLYSLALAREQETAGIAEAETGEADEIILV